MSKSKELLLTAFALFALFFGAGNLLLPPLLGYKAADNWPIVVAGFAITAVIIPIIGIYAHAKLQGTMFDFGKKVSPLFSSIFCIVVYAISIAIPAPRTAAATHEIAVYPLLETPSWLTSTIYFALVLVFVLNRSKIMSIIGKYLTPLIVIMLLAVIGIGMFGSEAIVHEATDLSPLTTGVLEGYQTFDAIGAAVVGAVIIISLNLRGHTDYHYKKELIWKAGLIAGLGLLIMYAGLIASGAYYGNDILGAEGMSSTMQRATLLRGIIQGTLGTQANTLLSVLLALACFTTAVGIIAGAADYFKGVFNNSNQVYKLTAVIGCVLGVVIGQLDFHSIIVVAIPVLAFIYPLTIVLILLNALPDRWASAKVFKAVAIVTFLFSLPDVIFGIWGSDLLGNSLSWLPLTEFSLGWVLPALLTFILANFLFKTEAN
ncbi:branched-chain amino acid transport system II carrier protein [Gilvibacter sp.]|uniref:branched-chain amino acid transport system II carrier protein n=1 Tax=Gilvibacter sp. TaxID=2729997 RepID=UPI0025BEF55C|nr:branched-chain amino acid transport system II carrier protein [Gilvibacter sp.]NQX76418.1 branched-chain amino acid transport system II carrier protein [Gilvibacter sp.]